MADFDDPLQRYQVMDPLGQGGSGTTFRGIDRATGRRVAIKVLSLRTVDGDWKRFDLFEREVAVLGTLDHPGIPRYIDSYASEGTGDYFLVMELVEGTPLSRHIAQGRRLEPTMLRDLLDQALVLLEYLHSLSPPVIHRDIKPGNLVLEPGGTLHLVDFGGVRQATSSRGGSTMIGTFGYMAPEQLHGESSPATDLYALGATIAALHAGAEADTLPHAGLHIDLEALALPPALAPALRRMLEPDPRQRARTVAEIRQVLRGPASLPPPGPRAQAPGPRAQAPSAGRPDVLPDPPRPAPLVATDDLRQLARVPAPVSVLVWVLTSLAAGSITVFQVLMLPLVFRLVRHLNRQGSARKRAELETNLSRFEQTVAGARQSLSHVASHTHPFRDSDEESGKGKGESTSKGQPKR